MIKVTNETNKAELTEVLRDRLDCQFETSEEKAEALCGGGWLKANLSHDDEGEDLAIEVVEELYEEYSNS